MIRRLLHRLGREEDGVALVMALAIMAVMAITTAGILMAGTTNQREAYVSDNARQAFAIAQEGLAYAEGCIYSAAKNGDATPSCTSSQTLTDLPVGSGTYYASVAGDGVTWTMTGTGTVNGVTRVVSAQASVPTPVVSQDTEVWNYLYADGTGGCTTWNGNVNVAVPILIRGNLCLAGSQSFTGGTLEVGGNLSVTGNASIGSARSPIQALKVGLTTSSTNTCNGVAPGSTGCTGTASPIYASKVGEGVDTIPSMPCIGQPSSLNPTCTGSSDGTWTTPQGTGLEDVYNHQAGLPESGCPSGLFDNDSTLNNSDTSIASVLFGSTAYDCTIGSSSSPCVNEPDATPPTVQDVCELKWDPSTKTLSASGEFYFDGSLALSGKVTYSGLATFYFTGEITANPATFCAASGTSGNQTCTGTWDTTKDGIIMIAGCWANSTGSSLNSSCVSLGGNTKGQFGVYSVTNYSTSGNASNMGPVLANSLSLGGTTQSLIPFKYVPPGTPLQNQNNYLPASSPYNWSG